MRQRTVWHRLPAGELAAMFLLFWWPVSLTSAQAPEPPPSVEETLERLDVALQQEQNLSQQTKDALRDLVRALRAERAQAAKVKQEPAPAAPTLSKGEIAKAVDEYLTARPPVRKKTVWEEALERLTFYGDLRLRHESDVGVDHKSTRNRERLRFRLGFNYQLNDEILLGARLITGDPDDPKSPHVTFGDVFDSFDISLDRAFLTYRPQRLEGAWVTVGKFGHPFYQNPVYGELLWDADIQPEGVAAGYTLRNLKVLDRLDIVVGEYLVLQQSDLDEASAFVFQLSGHKRLSADLDFSSAVGWYRYTSLNPDHDPSVILENRGNAVAGDEFLSKFSIVNPIVALTYAGLPAPLTLSAEHIINTRADRGDGTGWAAGLAYGRPEKAKDWRIYYQYHDIERDAVLSALAQDDFTLATNSRGHVFGLQYQITGKIGLHAWGLMSERRSPSSFFSSDAGDDQWRFRLDLNIKF